MYKAQQLTPQSGQPLSIGNVLGIYSLKMIYIIRSPFQKINKISILLILSRVGINLLILIRLQDHWTAS
jgi:hypothetical protein